MTKKSDPKPPQVDTDTCFLLAALKAHVRLRMDAGESLGAISGAIGVSLGTLRQWLYKARTGDAVSLETAIAKLGGADLEIPGRK